MKDKVNFSIFFVVFHPKPKAELLEWVNLSHYNLKDILSENNSQRVTIIFQNQHKHIRWRALQQQWMAFWL